MGVMDAARYKLGIRVPDELSVIGYDDIEMASWEAYDLSTVRQPIQVMIDEVVGMVDLLLKNDTPPETIKMIESERVIRGSSGSIE